MAKIDYELLRSRIHWVDLYAEGKTREEVVEQYKDEGATVNKVRSALKQAEEVGLIRGSHKRGNAATMDPAIRSSLMAGGDPPQAAPPSLKVKANKPQPLPPSPPSTFSAAETLALKAMVAEWVALQPDHGGIEQTGTMTHLGIRIDEGLAEAVKVQANKEGGKVSDVVRKALLRYLSSRQ